MKYKIKKILNRLITLVILFTLEFSSFFYLKDSQRNLIPKGTTFAAYMQNYGGIEYFLASYSQKFVLIFLMGYPIASLVLIFKEIESFRSLKLLDKFPINKSDIFINIFFYFIISSLYVFIQNPIELISNPYSLKSVLYAISPLAWMAYLLTVLNLIFPFKALIKLIEGNKILFGATFLGTVTTISAGNPFFIGWLLDFWANILLRPTIILASFFADIIGIKIQFFPPSATGYTVFGTTNFHVEMWPGCSGYEGISLVILILSFYCYIKRKALQMPRALIIIPGAMGVIFILNAVRLAALIAIGDLYSPDLALGGFHSVIGWLNLLITIVLSLLALSNIEFLMKRDSIQVAAQKSYEVNDIWFIYPLMVLIAISLLTQAFSIDFNWLYPIPILASAATIFRYRRRIFSEITTPSILSLIIGVIVFLIWVALIPADLLVNLNFSNNIQSVPLGIAMAWIFFRLMGSCLIVPVSEELLFRGFLQPRLETWAENSLFSSVNLYSTKSLATILSLLITSILFGILHSEILAGTFAGLFYGITYISRKRIIDSIAAHAVTNTLLSGYIIYSQNWSYW